MVYVRSYGGVPPPYDLIVSSGERSDPVLDRHAASGVLDRLIAKLGRFGHRLIERHIAGIGVHNILAENAVELGIGRVDIVIAGGVARVADPLLEGVNVDDLGRVSSEPKITDTISAGSVPAQVDWWPAAVRYLEP